MISVLSTLDQDQRSLVEAITQATLRQDFQSIADLLRERQINPTGIVWNPAPQHLQPPALGLLWQHWNALRGEAALPVLADLDLQALPRALRDHTMLLETLDPQGWDFRYRHFGEAIAATADKDWGGYQLSEMARSSQDALFYLGVYRAVMQSPFPIYTVNINHPRLRTTAWRRLILPLADSPAQGSQAQSVGGFLVGNVPETVDDATPLEDPGPAIAHAQSDYLRELLEASPISVGIFPEYQSFIFCNEALAQLLRLPHEQLMHRTLASFYQNPALAERHRLQLTRRQDLINQEIALSRHDGSTCWVVANFHRTRYAGREAVLTWLHDITERKTLESELRQLASIDALSSMLNRRAFMALADQEIARFQRYGHPLAVLMLDIDHFKRINDVHGHGVGDEAIRQLSVVLRAALRDSDTPGRLGGEEFAVLLPETDRVAALKTAERLRRTVAEASLPAPRGAVQMTVSVGVSDCREGDVSIKPALSRADQAMYQAKHAGRNRVVEAPAGD